MAMSIIICVYLQHNQEGIDCFGALCQNTSHNQGLKLTTILAPKCLSYQPFMTSTSQKKKKTEINQQLEFVYTGRDKATVADHFVSVLRLCDIDQNN